MSNQWKPEDSVATRDFFSRVSPQKFKETAMNGCPAAITPDIALKNDDNAVSRLACFRAGYEAAVDFILSLKERQPPTPVDPGFREM
jgi:hypothetical protein